MLKTIARITPIAACTLLVLSQIAGAEAPRQSVINDVQLGHGGKFHGQVVTRAGQPVANSVVSLQQGDATIARTVTDGEGKFAIAGLNTGVYQLNAAGHKSVHRAWSAQTAPPAAHRGVLVVSGGQTARGQIAGLGALGSVGAAAAVAGGGYLLYEEVINDDDDDAS